MPFGNMFRNSLLTSVFYSWFYCSEHCILDYVLCLEICNASLHFSKTESLYNSYRVIHDLAFCFISHDFSLLTLLQPYWLLGFSDKWLTILMPQDPVFAVLCSSVCICTAYPSVSLCLCLNVTCLVRPPSQSYLQLYFPVLVSHVLIFLPLFYFFFHSTYHLLIH